MNRGLYRLNRHGEPVKVDDIYQWCTAYENQEQRVVKQTQLGKVKVSTVFLGLDHNFLGKGPPIVWETMVFGGKLDQCCDRCGGSREQAQAMHERMVKQVEQAG